MVSDAFPRIKSLHFTPTFHHNPKFSSNRQLTLASLLLPLRFPSIYGLHQPAITDNVIFDTLAREWRCKWSESDDKKSLSAAQTVIDETLPKIKALDGLKNVQRVVCGGCKDLKLIISFSADKFDKLEEAALEAAFLEAWKAIDGIDTVETQTYTLMSV
jgi:hypothetical protein